MHLFTGHRGGFTDIGPVQFTGYTGIFAATTPEKPMSYGNAFKPCTPPTWRELVNYYAPCTCKQSAPFSEMHPEAQCKAIQRERRQQRWNARQAVAGLWVAPAGYLSYVWAYFC